MVIKNGKAAARRKSASSSTKSKRQTTLQENRAACNNNKAADELDEDIDCAQAAAVEGKAGDRVVEEAEVSDGAPRNGLPAESVELTAITLHQPWASLIAAGLKQYETRSWGTDYRGIIAIHAGKAKNVATDEVLDILGVKDPYDLPYGAIVAVANLTDCIRMNEEFILAQSSLEKDFGLWEPGRYAWKLENVRAIEPIPAAGKQGLWKWNNTPTMEQKFFELDTSIKYLDKSAAWNPADFGELHHVAEESEQLNLLQYDSEPPEPDDYDSIEQFKEAFKNWAAAQTDEAEEELANYGEQELCNQLVDGSTFAAESEPDSPLLESNCGEEAPTSLLNGTTTAETSCNSDTRTFTNTPTSTMSASQNRDSTVEYSSSLLHRLANHSASTESDLQLTTPATASLMYSELSKNCSPTLQSLKTLSDSSIALTLPATNQEVTSVTSSTPYRQTGTMRNGLVSGVMNSPLRGVGKDYLLLRSPGALSSNGAKSPPGKSRLESQLVELSLISPSEVAAPEFLESGYSLPIGFSNLQENRTALELAQQFSIVPKSELPQETETTAIAVQFSETLLTGELQPLDSAESNTLIQLPANIGSLSKNELLTNALEQHQLISVIERTEFELGVEKLHRARLTGIYFQEFKKRCRHGEFETELEANSIKPRRAQQYMSIAKNWQAIKTEAKAQTVALLVEENASFGIKWALDTIAQQKKALKSAAPPADPDSYQTPNTPEQPIVDLVVKALGGEIWVDPCSCGGSKIPAKVRYYKSDDGLAEHNHWNKTAFINPPFSDPLPWVEKCSLSIARGNLKAAIMLLKAGTVSNVGTGKLIEKYASAVCHWRGRINYLNDEGVVVKGSDFDCVFIYFGDCLDLFRQVFEQRGTISTINNHYSSVNKKYLQQATPAFPDKPDFSSVRQEEKQLAAAVGLSNGRSLFPDTRDSDRALMEQYDPYTIQNEFTTVTESLFEPIKQPETFDATPIVDQFEQAKQNCLADYITAISSNLSAFNNEQIAFLAKIINEESAKRIDF